MRKTSIITNLFKKIPYFICDMKHMNYLNQDKSKKTCYLHVMDNTNLNIQYILSVERSDRSFFLIYHKNISFCNAAMSTTTENIFLQYSSISLRPKGYKKIF